MAERQFDEIKSISFEDYFGEMELPEQEKKRRIELAQKFDDFFIYYFGLYLADMKRDYVPMIYDKYIELALWYLGMDKKPEYITDRASKVANDIQNTTRNNDSEYYTSKDRSIIISETETNVIGNYGRQVQAVKNGKHWKTWQTMKDNRVRDSHMLVDEKTIGIFDYFDVGGAKMLYPGDTSAPPEELIGCRCVLEYS